MLDSRWQMGMRKKREERTGDALDARGGRGGGGGKAEQGQFVPSAQPLVYAGDNFSFGLSKKAEENGEKNVLCLVFCVSCFFSCSDITLRDMLRVEGKRHKGRQSTTVNSIRLVA